MKLRNRDRVALCLAFCRKTSNKHTKGADLNLLIGDEMVSMDFRVLA